MQSSSFPEGSLPHYDDEAPQKAKDDHFSYTFKEWTPALQPVYENITYTAVYEPSVNSYSVTFVNEDGTVLQDSLWEYGKTPAYSGQAPTKEAGVDYRYQFAGWSPMLIPVTKKATYVAQYSKAIRQYYVTFQNDDGTKLENKLWDYGSLPSYSGPTPTKATAEGKTYLFAGWTPEITAVKGATSYSATYSDSPMAFTVSFVNDDGTPLYSSLVNYGELPVYVGATPQKAANDQWSYLFKGWDKDFTPVTSEQTYVATYVSSVRTYLVSFYNADGTLLQQSYWQYGDTPVYQGTTPNQSQTVDKVYSFQTWKPAITAVNSPVSYYASYSEDIRKYTITFTDPDGKVLDQQQCDYGSIPNYQGRTPTYSSVGHTYNFSGWNTALASVTGDTTYQAKFQEIDSKNLLTFAYDDATQSFTVTGCYDQATGLTIPASYDDGTHSAPVKKIENNAFSWKMGLTSCVVSEGISTMESNVFYYDSNLVSLHLPASLTSIDTHAVNSGCHIDDFVVAEDNPNYSTDGKALYDKEKTVLYEFMSPDSTYTIPDGVTTINNYAFQGDKQLTTIQFPESLANIYSYAFTGCTALTDIVFPSGLSYVANNAFEGCESLTSIHLPASLTTIGDNAFASCPKLSSVSIDENNPSYASDGEAIFSKDKTELFSFVSAAASYAIPEGVTAIAYNAFYNKKELASITFPTTLRTIGFDAFYGCASLTSVIIPEGTRTIDTAAFQSCSQLESISLPKTLLTIGEFCFSNCPKISTFSIDPDNPNYSSENSVLFNKEKTVLLSYCSTEKDYTIPTGVLEIAAYAFYGSSLTSVSCPDGLKKIGYGPFLNCNSLKTITLPENEVDFGDYALAWCCGLSSITLPSTLTALTPGLLWDDYRLTSVNIPVSITKIQTNSLGYCFSLQSLTYGGTMAQWSAITFDSDWKNGSPISAVVCSDGTIAL